MIGQTLSHYRILEQLGAGGMGVVYKAEDNRLDRIVAVKFPHIESERGIGYRSRFKREAKAAAALDHSSICPVYEFDEFDGQPYLVMPYIQGQSLRNRIDDGLLPPAEAILIAIQVAEGLQEAHAHRVIHRDIKSSNIIITEDGNAKILDFGLAMMKGATRLTSTGSALGTVSAMSPEQTRGEKLDHRTDVWSLGVVLYQMLTGQLPFRGDYEQAIVYAILNRQPAPASSIVEKLPPEIDWIIKRAMAKSRDDRYADMDEFLKDLRAIHKKISTGGGPGLPTWMLKIRLALLSVAIVLFVATVIVVMAWMRVPPFNEWEEGLVPWLTGAQVPQGVPRRISAGHGWNGQPAIAPGGTRIAFVSERSGNSDIYVIDAQGGVPLQLTTDPEKDEDPAWFPDGHAIVFTSYRGGGPAIWRVGQLGGGASLLLPNASEPAISQDGSRLAFVRTDDAGYERIWYAEMGNLSAARQLTTSEDGLWWQRDPVWSPDGSVVCYATRAGLRAIPVDGSPSYALTEDDEIDLDPAWSSDGRHIYFSSYREGTLAVWRVKSTGGRVRRVTLGTGPESHPGISRDRKRLAYTTEDSRHSLTVLDLETGGEHNLPNLRDDWMPTLAPDRSKVVFVSDRWGKGHDLWVQDLDGAKPSGPVRQLTTQLGEPSYPAFSPDGQWIAYHRILDGRRDIMTLSISTGETHEFTVDPSDDVQPAWSPGADRLAFASLRSGVWQIWIAGAENGRRIGEPRRLTVSENTATAPSWSPDGGAIAFLGHYGNQSDVFVIDPEAGSAARQITREAGASAVAWDPATGDLLVAAPWDEAKVSLRRFSRIGTEIGPTRFPVIFGEKSSYTRFAVSADGRLIVYVQQRLTGDVWLLQSEEQPY